ncbi:MAG: phage tail protein [Rivularia sp. (in: cyanobacteria)]|jgi:phage tail-like protein
MAKSENGSVGNELNYVTTNRFYVEIDSAIAASFTGCSGLGAKIQKRVCHEGGVNDQQRIHLGQVEFSDVTLKRGLTDNQGFWNWISGIFGKQSSPRRNVNILVFNQAGETMMSWTLIGAVPVGWKAPDLQADGNTVGIEELTLAYEGLEIGKEKGGGNFSTRTKTGYFESN